MSIVMVPAQGYTFGGLQAIGGTAFGSLGPIPVGVWIDRIEVAFLAAGVGTTLIGLVLGPSGSGDLGSFEAGSSIISGSRIAQSGKPILEFRNIIGSVQRLVVAVGRRVVSVQQFVTVSFTETAGGGVSVGNVSVHTLCAIDLAGGAVGRGNTSESGTV